MSDNLKLLIRYGVLLLAAGAGVYANSVHNPFIFDDLRSIVDNEDIRRLWPPTWAPGDHAYYPAVNSRPLVSLSLALNYYAGGLSVVGYHLFNLGVHLISALVLFATLRQLFSCKREWRPAGVSVDGLALGSALVWVVHPLHSQCINYLIQRSELLVGLFYLLTLYFALLRMRTGAGRWSAAAVCACAAGMGSKEVMVTAPLVVLAFHRTLVAPTVRRALADCPRLYAGLATTWLILLVLQWPAPHGSSIGFGGQVSPWTYALNQCWVVPLYLKLTIWPQVLVLDYGFPDPALNISSALPGAALLALMLAATAYGLWRRSPLGLAGLWFFLILAPTSTVVPIANEVAAERRVYLSSAAVAVLVVWAICWGSAKISSNVQSTARGPSVPTGVRYLGAFAVLAIVAGMGYLTVLRNDEHRSELAVWGSSVAAVPRNPRARNNLGVLLKARDQLPEAVEQYRLAIRLKPDYAEANYNLGNALEAAGDLVQAIAYYRRAIDADPGYGRAHNNLGLALEASGRTKEAIDHYRHALRLMPRSAETHNNLASAMEASGWPDSARAAYERALQLRSDYAEAHQNLANLLKGRGRLQEAVRHYRRAISIEPEFVEAHNNLGVVLGGRGERQQAIHHFRRAIHFDPEYAKAHNNLGNLLKSSGDVDAAIRHYEVALKIDPGFAEAHNNLGVALGAAGRPQEAIHHFETAVKLDVSYVRARHNLGVALHIAGRLDEAISQYEWALRLDPDFADARRTLKIATAQRN